MAAKLRSQNEDDCTQDRHCKCPSCHEEATFRYAGKQHWPEAVARRLGVESLKLWVCGVCETTVDQRRLDAGNQ